MSAEEKIILILHILEVIIIISGFVVIYKWYRLSWEIKKRKGKSTNEIEKERLILKTVRRKEALSKMQS